MITVDEVYGHNTLARVGYFSQGLKLMYLLFSTYLNWLREETLTNEYLDLKGLKESHIINELSELNFIKWLKRDNKGFQFLING